MTQDSFTYLSRKSLTFRVWDGSKMWRPGEPGFNFLILPNGEIGRVSPPPTMEAEAEGVFEWEEAEIKTFDTPYLDIMLESPFYGHPEGSTELFPLFEGDIVQRIERPRGVWTITLQGECFYLQSPTGRLKRSTQGMPFSYLGNGHHNPELIEEANTHDRPTRRAPR